MLTGLVRWSKVTKVVARQVGAIETGRLARTRFCEDDAARLQLHSLRDGRAKKARRNNHELENQIDCRDNHGTGHVAAYVCASPRRCATGRAVGSVPGNLCSVGDLRFVVREIEIGSSRAKMNPKNARDSGHRRFLISVLV
jgi:hypothetical protein